MDLDSESRLISLITLVMHWSDDADSYEKAKGLRHIIIQIICLLQSLDMESESESEFKSLIIQAITLFKSMDLDSQPKALSKLISRCAELVNPTNPDSVAPDEKELFSLVNETIALKPEHELISLVYEILSLVNYMNSDLESKLISLVTQLLSESDNYHEFLDEDNRPYIIQIISLLSTFDLESQPKPVSEFMSLTTQAIYVFKSIDLDSQPKPLWELISLFIDLMNPTNSDSSAPDDDELASLFEETIALDPEPELISLIYQIISLVSYMMNSKDENLIFLCPQARVSLGDDNILHILSPRKYNKWVCLSIMKESMLGGIGGSTYRFCRGCKGTNHERYKKVAVEIKHSFHPKHSLQLFLLDMDSSGIGKKCYCCCEYLYGFIYSCLACNYAMNMACAKKPLILSLRNPKWHKHSLALFPGTTSLICDVCALVDLSCPSYICSPCGFVVHQTCIDFPRVIRISRHPHRIAFTLTFNQGNWSCGVCRKEIHNDYGGYVCTTNCCSYTAHSKCATHINIWDGEDLDGVPDATEDIEPFMWIRDGIIRHFSHRHHLRLDENTDRDYDEHKLCQACINPIYYGNLYSCMQCDNFILHEECANLPLMMYHSIHPHKLTLVMQGGDVRGREATCSACLGDCTTGFFYECHREGCHFQVHVQCSVISEPLIHAGHIHPLFLTSTPGEMRQCFMCKKPREVLTYETFNCIECEFSLCFGCATLPQKVRYKHDKHTFVLSYGEEANTMASWCEICERRIDTRKGFYMCEEDCCVTLHVKCTIGKDRYMKPGSSWLYYNYIVDVLPNKLQMTRPICSRCKKRCPKVSFRISKMKESVFCSTRCMMRKAFLDN